MEPQNPGQSTAVAQALARRSAGGAPTAQLDQVSSQAAMQNPVPQPSNPSDVNKSSAPQVAPTQKWEPATQQDFVVSALAEQLKNSNKLEMEKLKLGSQPPVSQPSMGAMPVAQTAAAPAPQEAPQMEMGAGGGGNGISSSNFLKPINSNSSQGYFDLGVPSMSMSPGQQQNQFKF